MILVVIFIVEGVASECSYSKPLNTLTQGTIQTQYSFNDQF